MKVIRARNGVIAGALVSALAVSAVPANATDLGKWQYIPADDGCSIVAALGAYRLFFFTAKGGANAMGLVPDDQSTLVVGQKYKLNLMISGKPLPEMTTEAANFQGMKVYSIPLKAVGVIKDVPHGLALRISVAGKEVFDMDQAGSTEAFAAYLACSAKLGAKI